MSFVEQYQARLRRAFNIIKSNAADFFDEEALQVAVKSVNDFIGQLF